MKCIGRLTDDGDGEHVKNQRREDVPRRSPHVEHAHEVTEATHDALASTFRPGRRRPQRVRVYGREPESDSRPQQSVPEEPSRHEPEKPDDELGLQPVGL